MTKNMLELQQVIHGNIYCTERIYEVTTTQEIQGMRENEISGMGRDLTAGGCSIVYSRLCGGGLRRRGSGLEAGHEA